MRAVDHIGLSPGITREVRPLDEPVRARTGSERGAAVLEFAFAVPILFLIVTGIFRFSFAMNNYLMLTDGTVQGARLLAISRDAGLYTCTASACTPNTLDPCNAAATQVYGFAPYLGKAGMSFTFVLTPPGASSQTYTFAQGVSPTCSGTVNATTQVITGGLSYLVQGGTASLTVQYPCKLSVFGKNLMPSCKLTASATEIVE